MTSPEPLESRLARVEQVLAVLSAEVAAIRAEVSAPVAGAAPSVAAAAPAEPTARAEPPRRDVPPGARSTGRRRTDITTQDLERLVGRYGMLVIAVLTAAAAVGTFLSWAITHGYLRFSPSVRVLIGLAFAAAVGVLGFRVRRTERSFGSSLNGLALVIVHVCAYAAGPGLELVPTFVAFAGAAAASWVLALFAFHENDEPLWCVGVGGASLAPFVTSNGHGDVYALLAYGTLIALPATLAVSHRTWPVAWRLFYAVTALFALAGAGMASGSEIGRMVTALAFPFVIAGAGVMPFAPDSRKRGAIRWLMALALFVPAIDRLSGHLSLNAMAACLLGAAFVALLFADRTAELPQSSMFVSPTANASGLDWTDAAVIPFLLVVASADVAVGPWTLAAIYAAAAVAFSVFSWRRAVTPLRDAAASAAIVSAAIVVSLLPLGEPVARVGGYLVVGLAGLAMHTARPSRGSLITALGVLIVAASLSVAALVDRPIYQITPFATAASLSAALVTAGLVLVARFWSALRTATCASIPDCPRRRYASVLRALVRGFVLAPWIWAFIWGLIELTMAYSPSTSTLLLVTYFASTGVACVAVGRARRAARLRQAGLAAALLAAATAIYGASTYFDFGARIAAYLVTSAFLLGIAYWYRRPGSSPVVA